MDHSQLTLYYSDQINKLESCLAEINWHGLECWLKAQSAYMPPWLNIEDFQTLRKAAEKIISR